MSGPTTPASEQTAPPYFLWWAELTDTEFRARLQDPDLEQRAYWLGALLREAHTRDVWRYTTPEDVRTMWPKIVRHLGRSRPMWTWLLNMQGQASSWPPSTAA